MNSMFITSNSGSLWLPLTLKLKRSNNPKVTHNVALEVFPYIERYGLSGLEKNRAIHSLVGYNLLLHCGPLGAQP